MQLMVILLADIYVRGWMTVSGCTWATQVRVCPLMNGLTRLMLYMDENRTEISQTDRFCFLYYGSVFKHKKLSISIGFTIIFNHFLYSLIAKM
jgi:hypothetical protein